MLVARFRHPQRAAESDAYLEWFRHNGYQEVRQARWINEGEGDYLVAGHGCWPAPGSGRTRGPTRSSQEFFGVAGDRADAWSTRGTTTWTPR